MKKLLKVSLFLAIIILIAAAAVFAYYFFVTKDAYLDLNKLTNYSQSITVCDHEGNEITSASLSAKRKSITLEELNDTTVKAFIASEDRSFYSHGGLNYKRIIKAAFTNLASRSFKEGASTISQQLIKNTHLTGDKTIKRKLKEIKLTRKLENKYSKEEILEMYLNTIYFGHNCYGLESAAEFYFGTTADKLDTEQSATLVGLLTSPNNLSPFKNPEKCLARRNIVLKCMLDCNYLNSQEYNKAVKTPLSAVQTRSADQFSDYLSAVYDELEEILPEFYTIEGGCKITTYLDEKLQNFIENVPAETDSAIIITSRSGNVKAYRSTICGAKRQPASTIKPLLVYAPAIEEKIINPSTKILDEKINFNGYSPENYDKKYHGYVSVADCIAKSYNIPTVKTLNSLTIDKAAHYAHKMGIELSQDEKNLSLALGGMKYGLTLSDLCEKYRAFSNGGAYTKTKFIKEIKLKDGKILYSAKDEKIKIFSEGTSSLMNEMLINTAKEGTAKKLKNLQFEVAAKTGTAGTEQGNTDAYCIAYTSRDCIGVWLGDKDNKPLNITGGGECCNIAKEILIKLYENSSPENLETNSGTTTVSIDRDEYNLNNKIMLADDVAPKFSVMQIKVLANSVPKEKSTKFSHPEIQKPKISVSNQTVCIELCQTKYYSYLIKRQNANQNITIYDGNWAENIIDEPPSGNYIYTVTPYYSDGKNIYYGAEIILPQINTVSDKTLPQDVPDIVHKDWINE